MSCTDGKIHAEKGIETDKQVHMYMCILRMAGMLRIIVLFVTEIFPVPIAVSPFSIRLVAVESYFTYI